MKPVDRGANAKNYSDYKLAKPKLLARLGEQCSYCERSGDPQDLHVEHIYPKDPHPELEKKWENFLVSCNTCNTYKHHFQGNQRQVDLEGKFVWPHLDNTFRAFVYRATGEVDIAPTVPAPHLQAVQATLDMVGLLNSPAVAKNYEELGIAYDGANKRSQTWAMAEGYKKMYERNPTPEDAMTIADGAAGLGYFSIWMEVFNAFPEVREELIRAFKADPVCFDVQTQPVPKGRV
jgi:uncharacterized protein (TIGR02646 family)